MKTLVWTAVHGVTVSFFALFWGGCAADHADVDRSPNANRVSEQEPETATSSTEEALRWSDRGALVSVAKLRTLTADGVREELELSGFDASKVRYGVETYQLVYRTIDAKGRPITASGLVALPRGAGPVLRTVSYTHGTEVARADAPSAQERCRAGADHERCEDGWAVGPALTYASAGFAAVAADYLGLGVGPGFHPWMDIPTETSAALDMLRAALRLGALKGRVLRRDVLVTGFSQGASAALGLARALDARDDGWFRLGAVAPISGAYHWSGWVKSALSGDVEPHAASFYLSYLLVSWNRLSPIYDSPSDIFLGERAAEMESLFDGSHSGREIVDGIGPSPAEQLTTHAVDLLSSPKGTLASAFAVADGACSAWSTRAPVRLFFASGDGDVPSSNTSTCQASFRASGTRVATVDLGDVDHLTTNRTGTAAIVRWFGELSDDE